MILIIMAAFKDVKYGFVNDTSVQDKDNNSYYDDTLC